LVDANNVLHQFVTALLLTTVPRLERMLIGLTQAGPCLAENCQLPFLTVAVPTLLVLKSTGTTAPLKITIVLLVVTVLVPRTDHSPEVALLTLHWAPVILNVSVTAALTVTCCEQVAVNPAWSVAVQVTGVVPVGRVPAGLRVTIGVETLSVAVGCDNV
jgi:hypothetical protein